MIPTVPKYRFACLIQLTPSKKEAPMLRQLELGEILLGSYFAAV
jgi:hypothetical protein